MANLPSDLDAALDRVSAWDAGTADQLRLALQRVLQAADALTWSRAQLPALVAAAGPREVLQAVVDLTAELSGAPDVWAIAWTTRRGQTSIRALAGRTDGQLARIADGSTVTPDGLSRSIVGLVAEDGRPAWSDDAASDSRFQGAASVQAMALRSVGCVPLGTTGALYLHDPSSPGRFGPRVRSRVAALCAVAAPFLAEPDDHAAERGVEPLPGLVGDAPVMRELYGTVRAFAPMPWPVLILGETGTGKEAVANAIHALSPRASQPFVPVNCGTIGEELAESTLFGHERGAFTGADRRREGLVERVGQGTLFLDEVGELSPRVQVKLLRLLQEGTFERVGDERQRRFGGRVVAATHRNIHEGGAFREDLYHRLSACIVQVPPLRDRRTDIPALATHLLQRALSEIPGVQPVSLSDAALSELERRAWPGNVRELSNVLRGAVARALGARAERIEPEHLATGPATAAPTTVGDDARFSGDLIAATEQFQQARVRRALHDADGNKTRAAESLGVSRQWLHRLLKRWERQGVDMGS